MNWYVQNNQCSQLSLTRDNFLAKAIILSYTSPDIQYGDFYSDCVVIHISFAGLYCPYDFASSFVGTDLTILVNKAPAYERFASTSQMSATNTSITTTNATNKGATDVAKAVDSIAVSLKSNLLQKKKEYRIDVKDLLDDVRERVLISCDTDCVIMKLHLKPFNNGWTVDSLNVQQDWNFVQLLKVTSGMITQILI